MNASKLSRPLGLCAMAAAIGLGLSACKIEHKTVAERQKATSVAGSFESKNFDAKAEVEKMWSDKVVPTITGMAGNLQTIKPEMRANMDAVGEKHGHREKGEGVPWNIAARLTGKVISVDTDVSAGTADIDIDGDGKPDVQVQIGPVVKGTALRDILPFISFTSYTNQIDFAQLANALNDRAASDAFKDLDRKGLTGRKVELLGVFKSEDIDDMPVLTLLQLKVLSK
jgi:predicted lipoprotein